ncbi:MAG: glycosyltransferase family 4 protein [Lachnospiraceae bacterium]|jgi:glycosyltransferase involved in cell wall biosynthesis|nr:glycosyltransferase family 4 protein [Lachnospiraceae bacterium]
MKKNILALSWRDIRSPKMGGAEVLSHGMLKRLDPDRYEITHLSAACKGAPAEEIIDGIRYIRRGGILTVIWHAFRYYRRNRDHIDYVIDECNTHRFFTPFYVPRSRRVLFIHQLTREIWFVNCPFLPALLGYLAETPMLKIYRRNMTVTVSESTKQDLIGIGFSPERIQILHNGIDDGIRKYMEEEIPEEKAPVFIYIGRYAAYKGIDICLSAFAAAGRSLPGARLWMAGKVDMDYFEKHLKPVCEKEGLTWAFSPEPSDSDVTLLGYVSEEDKYRLMKRAHLLLFPSLREGWGIIVTEAALLGTPSLVYDAPGARDAVDHGRAGYLCGERNAACFAQKMIASVTDLPEYEEMKAAACAFSKDRLWGSPVQQQEIRELEERVFP